MKYTPEQARSVAEVLDGFTAKKDYADFTSVSVTLRSLASQVEALTAELNNIASANLKTWDKDYNTTTDFMAWAQSRARAAIAKGTDHG